MTVVQAHGSKGAFTPGNMLCNKQHVAERCRQHVTCISATCIPLYTATDWQQTAGNKQHVEGNMLPGNMLPDVNAA